MESGFAEAQGAVHPIYDILRWERLTHGLSSSIHAVELAYVVSLSH